MTVSADTETLKNVTIQIEKVQMKLGKILKMEKALLNMVLWITDFEKAVEGNRFCAGCLVPAMFKYRVSDPPEVELHANAVGSEMIKKNFLCATDAEGLIHEIERFKNAGITHFCLGNSSPNVNYGIDIFKDVIPAVKD
jgi:hypothetical protein